MAPFDVDRVCWRIVHDPAFYEQVQADPQAAIADVGLTDEERRLLLAGDVGALYELGVSGFLMEHLANWRAFGVGHESYSDLIRQARWIPSW
jgi:hypothetical protein